MSKPSSSFKKACLVVSKPYQNNKIFNRNDKTLNRDDCLVAFSFLKMEFLKHGINLSTQDINTISDSDYIIYNDMPFFLPRKMDIHKSFLLILESPLIVKSSWDLKKHKYFNKIFTWNDEIIDNKKYFKINYSYEFPNEYIWKERRTKFCAMITAHKTSNGTNELYTERIKTIRWFEQFAPSDFNLYGIGWDKPSFTGILKIIKKIPFIFNRWPMTKFSSYKGKVDNKLEVYSNYNFSICYENVSGFKGYITEKIFDCFFAGTIPIYLGAENISNYIPENCFIDRRKFNTTKEVYDFTNNFSETKIEEYRNNIKVFLMGQESKLFNINNFSNTIVKNLIKANK